MINVIYLYKWGSDIAFYKQKCIAEAHFMEEYVCESITIDGLFSPGPKFKGLTAFLQIMCLFTSVWLCYSMVWNKKWFCA